MKSRKRVGDWMQTHTGRAFWPLDPRSEEVDIEDIAHALAQQNRYAGHTPFPFSVAQHSVLVSWRCEDLARGLRADQIKIEARWGLLHDASEAYLVDVPRPVKRHLKGYMEIEAEVMNAIEYRFDLHLDPKRVPLYLRADEELLATEAAILFPDRPRSWKLRAKALESVRGSQIFPRSTPCCSRWIYPWDWKRAKTAFLDRWENVKP